jgi:hypothetical protein
VSAPLDAGFEPARPGSAATSFECGLCGFCFTHGARVCASCAWGAECSLVRCPRCGYQFPRQSRLALALARLASRLRGHA